MIKEDGQNGSGIEKTERQRRNEDNLKMFKEELPYAFSEEPVTTFDEVEVYLVGLTEKDEQFIEGNEDLREALDQLTEKAGIKKYYSKTDFYKKCFLGMALGREGGLLFSEEGINGIPSFQRKHLIQRIITHPKGLSSINWFSYHLKGGLDDMKKEERLTFFEIMEYLNKVAHLRGIHETEISNNQTTEEYRKDLKQVANL